MLHFFLSASDFFTEWGEGMQRLRDANDLRPIYLDSFSEDSEKKTNLSGTQLIIRRLDSASDWTNFLKAGAWVGLYGDITFSEEQIESLTTVPKDQFSALLDAHAELMHNRRINNEESEKDGGGRGQQPLEGAALVHAEIKVKLLDNTATADEIVQLAQATVLEIKIEDYDLKNLDRYIWDLKKIVNPDFESLLSTLDASQKTHGDPSLTALKDQFTLYKKELDFYEKTRLVFPQDHSAALENPDEIWLLLHGMGESPKDYIKYIDKSKLERNLVDEFGFFKKDTDKLCIIPQAPLPFHIGGIQTGFKWTNVESIKAPNEATFYADLKKYSRAYLEKLIKDIRTKYPTASINLLGMSLGAMAALDLGTHPEPEAKEINKVIALAGGFENSGQEANNKNLKTKFFLFHSENDVFVPRIRSENAIQKLRENNILSNNDQAHLYEGIERHIINKKDSKFIAEIIADIDTTAKEIEVR